jgi:hypothetical protein
MIIAMKNGAAMALGACILILGIAPQVGVAAGGFGGVSGGGMRPTGSSSAGFNRAGTSSSGGFSYGDAPRSSPTVTVSPDVAQPCNAAPVTVDGAQYYKCGGSWYTPALSDAGIVYTKVAPPPGH